MVVSQLNGGLGNQMFQYAAGKALSLHHKVPLLIDDSQFRRDVISELEVPRVAEIFNFEPISDQIIDSELLSGLNLRRKNPLSKLLPRHRQTVYREPHYHFDANFFRTRKNVLLKGAWQSFKYFQQFEPEVTSNFLFKDHLTFRVKDRGFHLSQHNSVSVHIRRNDYLRLPIILEWHGVMQEDYYRRSLELLRGEIGTFNVYYFTDDPQWVIEKLMPENPGVLISGTESSTPYEDFHLMSCCRHNIIANSSFSWWSAYLNKNPDKIVIAPDKWFDKGPQDTQDLIPASWKRL